MAAKLKEVVVTADLFDLQHLAPDFGDAELQLALHLGKRCLQLRPLTAGGRQGVAVELAVGGHRQ